MSTVIANSDAGQESSIEDPDPSNVLSPELMQRFTVIDGDRVAAAAAVEAGGDPPPDPGNTIPAVSIEQLAGNITAFLQLAVAAFAPAFPQLPAVWPPEVCAAVGKAAAPVALKRGWLFTFTAYQDEIALAIVTVPLLAPTLAAVKAGRTPPAAGTVTVPAGKPNEKTENLAAPTFLKPSSTARAA